MVVYGCIMDRAMGETSQWYDMFADILQCPVCLEVPQCPILQCSTGHHICVFCKNNVPECPLCKARFLETRNFLAEDVVNKLEHIKLSIENEIQNIRLDGNRESTSTYTQTDFEEVKSKSSSSTQTDETARTNIENRRPKGTAPSVSFCSCQIGSCMFKSSYKGLVQHLAEYHKDTFYEVQERNGQFTETCVITTIALPQTYDFAFLKNGTDLFFFNIAVHGNGRLKACVLLAKKIEIANQYHYDLAIKNGAHQLTQHGKVIPCGGSTEMVCSNSVRINNEHLSRSMLAKLVEVTITIRRCACRQFRRNVVAVNP
ncbi:E3 ubiquitin-protein ligase siah2-like [Andrena cerasifolii]|uniref:E3 ubiquitin-protein ligase siah2-like n=1 Tax=Andrena cerasifolii TaxID=2819439 RepID=UPI004037C82F